MACNVFLRAACRYLAKTPCVVDVEFIPQKIHNNSDLLRSCLQKKIDESANPDNDYQAILLAYGLCGNSAAGLVARRLPLIIPRAHDCCAIFLGSRQAHQKYFSDNPSRPFTSDGYHERGAETSGGDSLIDEQGNRYTREILVEKYGEENAAYLIETMFCSVDDSEDIVYIEDQRTSFLGIKQECRQKARQNNKRFICLPGDNRLLKNLIYGQWNKDEFLALKPGQKVEPVYDWDTIIIGGETEQDSPRAD